MSRGEDFIRWSGDEGAQKVRFLRDENGGFTRVVKRLDAELLPIYAQLMRLKSPHLPEILALREEEGCIEVEEAYIEGASLQFLLDEYGAQSEEESLLCGRDTALALCAIHALEPPVIHRDIKPLNIMRREGGGYVLIDFDAARSFSPAASQDTQCILTPGYAPPEQYGFGQSDARSDIFSLGATLYEMRTGKRYRPGEGISGALGRIISKCIAFEPKRRYKNARSLYRALCRARQRLPAAWLIPCAAAAIALVWVLTSLQNPASRPPGPPQETPPYTAADIPAAAPLAAPTAPAQQEIEYPCSCVIEMELSTIDVTEIQLQNGEPYTVQIGLIPFFKRDGCRAKVHAEDYTLVGCLVSQNAIDEGIASITDGGLLTVYRPGFFFISVQAEFNGTRPGRSMLPVTVTEAAAQS